MTTTEDRKAKLAGNRGRVPPVKLAHIVRRTSRFEEMVRWYETVLGAHVVHADEMLAFLTYDDEHHRIAIARLPGLEDQPPLAAGTDHVAFMHADLGDLLYMYQRLKSEAEAPRVPGAQPERRRPDARARRLRALRIERDHGVPGRRVRRSTPLSPRSLGVRPSQDVAGLRARDGEGFPSAHVRARHRTLRPPAAARRGAGRRAARDR